MVVIVLVITFIHKTSLSSNYLLSIVRLELLPKYFLYFINYKSVYIISNNDAMFIKPGMAFIVNISQ